MKNIFLFLFLLNFIQVNSQIFKNFFDRQYRTDIETIKFIVLDFNIKNQNVAYKHIYTLPDLSDEAGNTYEKTCDCGYAGMEDYPKAGVVLGTYCLEKDTQEKTFKIYSSVYDKKDCMGYNQSKQNLNDAKRYFKTKNLNIDTKAEMKEIIKFSDKNKFKIPEKYSSFFKVNCKRILLTFEYKVCEILYNDQVLYKRFLQSPLSMASFGYFEIVGYYKKNNFVIFLEKYRYTSANMVYREFYGFSPIIDLNNL